MTDTLIYVTVTGISATNSKISMILDLLGEIVVFPPPRISAKIQLLNPPSHFSKNLLMIGKSYLMLSKKAEAKEYLQRTLTYPVKTEDDQEAVAEAESLLKGL